MSKLIFNHEMQDFISDLPDLILHVIISHLSIEEVFRTSILSKRWIHLWKSVSHFDFDCTRMVNPKKTDSSGKKRATKTDVMIYNNTVNHILHQHKGNLISGCFKHFRHQNGFEVLTSVEFLIERKRISSLSLECENLNRRLNIITKDYFKARIFSNLSSLELTNYKLEDSILSAFESCERLKVLKLKNMFMVDTTINGILQNCYGLEKFSLVKSKGFNSIKIENKSLKILELFWLNVGKIHVRVEDLQVLAIDSIICPPKDLRIYSENIRSFCSAYNPFDQRTQLRYNERNNILKTQDILENCSDLFKSQPINIFRKLLTLSIDLDLNNIREVLALSYVLMSCSLLNTLKITIPANKANKASTSNITTDDDDDDDCALPYVKSMFWETREMYYFELFENLKFVTLKGFTGKEQEVIFAKLLIARAYMMEKMHVICDSTIVDEAKDLLSLPRSSSRLSIILE
ncbi:F-box protein At1g80960 [Lathyrus oleraceus]|uniref:F-box domain-containing protein n=1 Tax=Pisum sativum TaxID=3888 RepID=A0A9D4VYE5_PEA|nr:F-box protein At1g80960-like [Pisum sativum]KAI5391797.1 hypothetical protein KIW84_076557 [Pisum sativum]